ncbi:MAG: MFS transporter [Acidobacteria bacterium]|nr:MFS transporter [Acidobacteriota bacterium]
MKKWTVVALLGGMAFATDLVRISLGIVAPTLMSLYDISPGEMGIILSGWNWAYTGSLLMIGPVVDRFGAWLIVGIGAGFWGMATLALPLASTVVSLFVMRALFGLGHSMRMPSQAACISRWMGPDLRATAVGLCFFGGQIGLAIGPGLAAVLVSTLGWEWVFYASGSVSLLFCLTWFALYPRDKGEGQLVASQVEKESDGVKIPWSSLLRYRATWGIALGQLGYLYSYFFFMSWFPSYLRMERNLSLPETGIVAGLPFLMGMVGTAGGGWLGDHLIRRGVSRSASRKGMIVTGLSMTTILVVAAAFTSQTWLAVTLLTLCMGFLRMTTASANAMPIDLAPAGSVASLASIQNFAGNVSGLLAPIVTGYTVGATGSFFFALLIAGGMAMLGACSFLFLVGPLETLPVPKSARVSQ